MEEYLLLCESRTMSSGSDDHLTDFITPSPPPYSFFLWYPLLRESRTMSSWPHCDLTDFMTPSPPLDIEDYLLLRESRAMLSLSDGHLTDFMKPSPPGRDLLKELLSCMSRTMISGLDGHLTDFMKPSPPERDQDSATASTSRQSDSSNGDNIHGQEEPSSVRDRSVPNSRMSKSMGLLTDFKKLSPPLQTPRSASIS